MGCPGQVYLGGNLVFSVTTHDADTGEVTDADAVPSYRIYQDNSGTVLLSGTMAKLDDSNTLGFYVGKVACTVGNGFTTGVTYTIYVVASVNGSEGAISYGFTVQAELNTLAERLGAMVEADGLDYRFTANALEQGPNAVISDMTQAIYAFITGRVAKGTIVQPLQSVAAGQVMILYQTTSYETPNEIRITLGPDFSPFLDGSLTPYFSMSKYSTQTTPDLETVCTVADQGDGILKLALTVDDTDLTAGDYRWQIKLLSGDGTVAHVSAEGKATVKATLKRPPEA